tara:strand:+ start:285 stop:902 length:618 start_codon:yes stop_codon:yes gene_type:complete
MAFKMKGSTHYGKGNSSPAKAYGKPSPAKDYSVNKGSHNHPHGDSPNKFLGGMLKKIGGAAKGMLKGKDGKFGIGDVGRLALGPLGAAGGAAGLFMKDSPAKKYKSDAQRKAVHASKAERSPAKKTDDKVVKAKVLPTVNVSAKADKVKITKNKDGGFTKSKGKRSQTYKPNPNYKKGSARTTNYKYITGESDSTGAPIGTNYIG